MMQIKYNNIINVRIDISLEITYINIYINNRKYLQLLVQLLHIVFLQCLLHQLRCWLSYVCFVGTLHYYRLPCFRAIRELIDTICPQESVKPKPRFTGTKVQIGKVCWKHADHVKLEPFGLHVMPTKLPRVPHEKTLLQIT